MNLKNLVWISTFLTSCVFSIHTQEQSFKQSLELLWTDYKKKFEHFETNIQQSSFNSKEDLDRACIELQELTQSFDHIIAYVIEKGEYKGSLKIILDDHKALLKQYMQVELPMLTDYTIDCASKVSAIAERLKSLKQTEWFYKLMQIIGENVFLEIGIYIINASDLNAGLPQIDSIDRTLFSAGIACCFIFFLLDRANLDAQANIRNYIREHNLDKAKELEGWEKEIGKQWNLDTNV